jgi:site-specific DNA-methyltransferase (adenine-specific)
MRKHEDVLVFGNGKINYYPLMELRDKAVTVKNYSKGNSIIELNNTGTDNISRTYTHKNPDTIIKECWEANAGKLHTSQKPVALMEYLIKTYTNEGETVLDNCMGSGTTGVACKKTGRHFIGIEKDEKYFEIAVNRITSK